LEIWGFGFPKIQEMENIARTTGFEIINTVG
jgi:hypothetical protein